MLAALNTKEVHSKQNKEKYDDIHGTTLEITSWIKEFQ